MTMSYRRTEKAYEPCYAVIPAERQRFMQRLESGLLAFTGNTIKKEIKNIEEIDCVKYRDTIKKIFRLFMGYPTEEEGEIFGKLEFSDDVLDEKQQEVAAEPE